MNPTDSTAESRVARRAARLRESVAMFDILPAPAILKIPVVLQIASESRAGWYAGVKKKTRPPIVKIAGGRASGVEAGELRRYLAEQGSYRQVAA